MKRRIFVLHIFLILSAMSSYAQETLVFIGDTGVGKSAIINALIGSNVAKSGFSFGEPLTKDIAWYEHDAKLFIDTPPVMILENQEIAELQAKSIGLALGKPGTYRIFFVLQFSPSGKMEDGDKRMIDLVLTHLPFEARYNIIFNKVSKRMREMVTPKLDLIRKELPAATEIILIENPLENANREVAYKEDFSLPFSDTTEDLIFNKSVSQVFTKISYENGKLLLQ